jgi:hypothetical protein
MFTYKIRGSAGMEILNNIPLQIEHEEVLQSLKLGKKGPSMGEMVRDALDTLMPLAKPKVLYKESYIGKRGDSTVEIDGVEFKSGILVKNLENTERVFPYVVTAGRELEGIEVSKTDMMKVFLYDALKELILERAFCFFEDYLKSKFALDLISHMNPGSLTDWPVSQQKRLFQLFGDVESLIGVRLTPSYLMDPIKSVSGIYFPTEVSFQSCMLCKRPSCPKRRAPYDPEMAKQYKGEEQGLH